MAGATVHPLVTVANPLDYHTFSWGDEAALAGTFTAFARAGFDATMLVLDFPRTDRCEDAEWWVAANAFERAIGARSRLMRSSERGRLHHERSGQGLGAVSAEAAPVARDHRARSRPMH